MARKSILDKDRFTFKLYIRTLPKGNIYYARFFEKNSSVILADRSTGETEEDKAKIAAGKLLAQLPLEKINRTKIQQHTDEYNKAEALKEMSLAEYLVWFWDVNKSDYIKDRIDAEKALTKIYIKNQHRYMFNHAVFLNGV